MVKDITKVNKVLKMFVGGVRYGKRVEFCLKEYKLFEEEEYKYIITYDIEYKHRLSMSDKRYVKIQFNINTEDCTTDDEIANLVTRNIMLQLDKLESEINKTIKINISDETLQDINNIFNIY